MSEWKGSYHNRIWEQKIPVPASEACCNYHIIITIILVPDKLSWLSTDRSLNMRILPVPVLVQLLFNIYDIRIPVYFIYRCCNLFSKLQRYSKNTPWFFCNKISKKFLPLPFFRRVSGTGRWLKKKRHLIVIFVTFYRKSDDNGFVEPTDIPW